MSTPNSEKIPSVIQDLYYGGYRVQRIYQNGKLVWFAGDALPLNGYIVLGEVYDHDGGLTRIPLRLLYSDKRVGVDVTSALSYFDALETRLGDADNDQYVEVYTTQYGTTIYARVGSHYINFVIYVRVNNHAIVAYARLGNHTLDIDIRVTDNTSGIVAIAKLVSQIVSYSITVTNTHTVLKAIGKIGNHSLNSDVRVLITNTGLSAIAKLASHSLDSHLTIGITNSIVKAVAKIAAHSADQHIDVVSLTTAIRAWARLISHSQSHDVAVTHFTTGLSAWAVITRHSSDNRVDVRYMNEGFIAAIIGNLIHEYSCIVGADQILYGTSVHLSVLYAEPEVEVGQHSDLSGESIEICNFSRIVDDMRIVEDVEIFAGSLVIAHPYRDVFSWMEDDVYGSIQSLYIAHPYRDVFSWMEDDVQGSVVPLDAVLFDHCVTDRMIDDIYGSVTDLSIDVLNHFVVNSSLDNVDGGINVLGTALSNYDTNICIGDSDPEYYMNVLPFRLGDNVTEIRCMLNKDIGSATHIKIASLSANHVATFYTETEAYMDAPSNNPWEDPIQTGYDLYIRQTYGAVQNGPELILE